MASGPRLWLVDDEWPPVELPRPAPYVSRLRDATTLAVDSDTWCLGNRGRDRFAWVEVRLRAGQ